MRPGAPRRIALAVVATWVFAFSAAGAGGPATSEGPACGLKAEGAAAEAPAVPGLTPWGAVVMALLMLTSSSFALYAGSVARLKLKIVTRGADRPSDEIPATKEPRRQAPRWPQIQERQSQLYRQRRTGRRPHSATSQSKKRRLGAGCRGPLRKT